MHRDTVTRALESETLPRYVRSRVGSKLDSFKGWVCEQLREDPTVQSQWLREMAVELDYRYGKTIVDD